MPRKKRATSKSQNFIERDANYLKYYVTNVMVHPTDIDIRFEVFNERQAHGKHWDLVADAGLILTPEAALLLRDQLGSALKKYEESHGQVKLSRLRSTPISPRGAPVDS